MSFEIIDNFLKKEEFDKIKSTFFPKQEDQEKISWRHQKGIVRDPNLGPTTYDENDWMYSYSFMPPQTKEESKFVSLITPIFDNLNAEQIIDARANLIVPTKTNIHHEDHVDRKTFHKVALFYVTTNNGYTILKDTAKVECVKNRMLIFDGSIYHHSVSSTDDIRCVININYIPYSRFGNINYIYK